jgi:hypothetical protein
MRRVAALLMLLTPACSGLRTNDRIMDDVLRRESGFFSRVSCIRVNSRTHVLLPDHQGPPAMLEPQKIQNPNARRAAEAIATMWNDAESPSARIIGKAFDGRCPVGISRPVRSGRFAFVTFSGPSAKIGAYVYHRTGGAWQYLEEVPLGFWWVTGAVIYVRSPPMRSSASAFSLPDSGRAVYAPIADSDGSDSNADAVSNLLSRSGTFKLDLR